MLSVKDTGRGLPKAMLEQVFELFVQVSPTLDRGAGGLGLGLTLVKRLVEMHGGTVVALSDGPGHGTELKVRLPLEAEQVVEGAGAPKGPASATVSRSVLVIEDSEDVLAPLKDLLEDLGHRVAVATRGDLGLSRLLELRPDVALVDVGLPGLDGYEVARRARADGRGAGLFLVALTGYGGPEAVAKARAAGFDLHLTKPIDVDALAEVINRGKR